MKKSKIGILTGGGDCAGLNPAMKWAVKTALDERVQRDTGIQYEMLGIRDGWKGLMQAEPRETEQFVISLTQETVRTWDRYGGTMLGTSRTNPYDPKDVQSKLVLTNIETLGLDALIVIGGDDTLGVAHKLAREGVNIVGVPKTIDKDLCETDYTLGFETALDTITQEVDRLRTTAGSHKRIFVVETMGRETGWLALEGGESSGAYIILIPEHGFSIEKVNKLVLEGWRAKTRYDIIIVAEGAKPAGYAQFTREQRVDSFGHKALGGIGEFLADEIQKGTELETRWVVLSHLQRGGVPCAYDRRMGRYFGIAAMNLVMMRDFGKMVCYKNGRITACPLEKVIGKLKYVDVKTMYDVERYNGRRSILGRKNKMYRDHGRLKDEMTSAEQSGNTRLRKGVSATPGELDTLIENAVFGADDVREHSCEKIRQFASAQGVVLASIDDLYRAAGKGLYTGITVPAINIRGITYQVARAVFRAALKDRVGAFIFEIARSEIGYTAQRPGEYAACVLAAAVTEGFTGPVFLQGDHFQVNRAKYNSEPERELNSIRELIREAVSAGFLNIDIDASTIVDLEKSSLEEQQKENCQITADMTKFIREIEPKGITISVGGEIGEVGGQNSTVADLRAFIIGYLGLLGPNVKGLSKISVQTGTTHGGVILPDGSMASVNIDFKALKELSRAARKEYGMGGAVQHGASTLPDEAFDLFPQADTLEVHLATGFQNIVFDSPYFPKELLDIIYRHLRDKYASEMKQGDTSEQFLYKTRKKAFGDFKKELWNLSGENLRGIGNTLEERFSLLFRKLKVAGTMDLVGQFVDY